MILSISVWGFFFQKERTTVCLSSDPDIFVNNTFVFGTVFPVVLFLQHKDKTNGVQWF